MKQILRHRRAVSYLLVALVVCAIGCRAYLSHGSDYYESLHNTEKFAADNGEWVDCNCPVCHAEEFIATEAEYFEYHPFVNILLCELGVPPTAEANHITIISSLRGPPYLS